MFGNLSEKFFVNFFENELYKKLCKKHKNVLSKDPLAGNTLPPARGLYYFLILTHTFSSVLNSVNIKNHV